MTGRISDARIKEKIVELTQAAGAEKTICPSEVARALSENEWRELMPSIRKCADELKKQGELRILQKGESIESAQQATGPIRLSAAKKTNEKISNASTD